jgi:uncharacterized membrane protein YphA (DoxX/SURF4 family)
MRDRVSGSASMFMWVIGRPRSRRPRRFRALDILYRILGASFVLGGIAKFVLSGVAEWPAYAEEFVEWGYPQWVRFFVGSIELIGGALLTMVPRLRLVATGMLAPIMIGAVVTHIVNDSPLGDRIFSPLILVLLVIIGSVSAPWDWRAAWATPTSQTSSPSVVSNVAPAPRATWSPTSALSSSELTKGWSPERTTTGPSSTTSRAASTAEPVPSPSRCSATSTLSGRPAATPSPGRTTQTTRPAPASRAVSITHSTKGLPQTR